MIDFSDLETPISDVPAKPARATEKHACVRCAGTGKYRGVRVHQAASDCFACNGRGYFLTSVEQRAKAKAQRAARAERKGAENLALFAEQHPAESAWLATASGDFAESLLAGVRKYGGLTEKQLAAVRRAVERDAGRADEAAAYEREHGAEISWLRANAGRGGFAADLLAGFERYGRLTERQLAAVSRIVESEQNAVVVDLSHVANAFAAAAATGKKRLKLRVPGFVFSAAPSTGRNAGMIYVKTGDEYIGKVREDGVFLPTRDCTDDDKRELQELDKDVLAAAQAYGLQTGTCSCCGRELTNKLSVELGIGPICRENWGL